MLDIANPSGIMPTDLQLQLARDVYHFALGFLEARQVQGFMEQPFTYGHVTAIQSMIEYVKAQKQKAEEEKDEEEKDEDEDRHRLRKTRK